MEKIKLKNEQIFNVIPLGILGNDITKRKKISFKSDLPYQDIEAVLSNPDNIESIQYMLENDVIIATYSDCVSLKSLSKDIDTGIYTAEFSTDAVEKKMKEMQMQIDVLEKQKEAVTEPQAEPEPEIKTEPETEL